MTTLWAHWADLAQRLRKAPYRLFLFDYDGTLTPIADTPGQARLSSVVRERLQTLARQPRCSVGVISGRALAATKRLVRIPSLFYAGNHGLEIGGPGIHFVHPLARAHLSHMRRLAAELSRRVATVPGAWVERKGLTLSVHYRGVPRRYWSRLQRNVQALVTPQARRPPLTVRTGKRVLDIRPAVPWHKGAAVRWLTRQVNPRAVLLYVGDDTTDEDAFRAVRGRGIAIRVGRSPTTAARYYLSRQSEVPRLLARLIVR